MGRRAARPKGLGRRLQGVREQLEALHCDPVEGLALIAMGRCPCLKCRNAKNEPTGKVPDPAPRTKAGRRKHIECPRCKGSKKEPITPELQSRVLAELMRYCYPSLKAIEHRVGEGGSQGNVTLSVLLGIVGEVREKMPAPALPEPEVVDVTPEPEERALSVAELLTMAGSADGE